MSDTLTYRAMEPGEEAVVVDLVLRCFDEFVAPGYVQEGVDEFHRFARALPHRQGADHLVLVAADGDELGGMIEMFEDRHVAMLFVDRTFQRRGIAGELTRRALAICRSRNPQLDSLTVNAAPTAVAVYERLGFRPTEPEKTVNGIRFVPMTLALVGE